MGQTHAIHFPVFYQSTCTTLLISPSPPSRMSLHPAWLSKRQFLHLRDAADPWADTEDPWHNRSVHTPQKKKKKKTSENYIAREGRTKEQGEKQIQVCCGMSWRALTENSVEGGLGLGAWGEAGEKPTITRMLEGLTEAHFKEQDSTNLSYNHTSFRRPRK